VRYLAGEVMIRSALTLLVPAHRAFESTAPTTATYVSNSLNLSTSLLPVDSFAGGPAQQGHRLHRNGRVRPGRRSATRQRGFLLREASWSRST
jgi:hypothetical protein